MIFAASIASDEEKFKYFDKMMSPELTKPNIIELHYLFEERVYERGNHLFAEGQPITHLYFIKYGEVELSRRLKKAGRYDDRPHFKSFTKNRDLGQNARYTVPTIRPEILGLCGEGQIIGEDDFLRGLTHWSYSCKASHHTTNAYVIDKVNWQNSYNTLGKFLVQLKKLAMVIVFVKKKDQKKLEV